MVGPPGGDLDAIREALRRAADTATRLPAATAALVDGALRRDIDARLHAAVIRYHFVHRDRFDLGRSDTKLWMLGLDALLEDGHLDVAGAAIRSLRRVHPTLPWLQTMALMFRRLPDEDPGRPLFRDDRSLDLQLAPRPGAATLIVVFRDVADRVSAPVTVVHRWLGRLDAHILYLRDAGRTAFTGGVASLGAGVEATAAGIRRLADELGARRIVALGNSLGGYAALRYGPAIGADRVLAFVPPTGDPARLADVPDDRLKADWVDVVPLYRGADGPRARILFGAWSAADRGQALRLDGLARVALEAIPRWGSHDMIGPLLRAGRLDAVIGWLVAPGYELDAGALRPDQVGFVEPPPPPRIVRAWRRLGRIIATRRWQ